MTRPGPFQILKMLPQTNCKECGLETCMALATSVYAYGPAGLKKCPHLSSEVIQKIEELFGDTGKTTPANMIALWEGFRKKLGDLDWSALKKLEGFSEDAESGGVRFEFLTKTVTVTPRDILIEGGSLVEHTKILIYYFILGAHTIPDTFEFMDYRSFYAKLKVRDVKQEEFEEKVQEVYRDYISGLMTALENIGGVENTTFKNVYDLSMQIKVFPKLFVLVLYNKSEDEFKPFCKFMFDSRFSCCFDAEGLEYLADYLADTIILHKM